MKKLIAAAALATLIAAPAFAQSYDPSLGSGNIARQTAPFAVSPSGFGAYAQAVPGAVLRYSRAQNKHRQVIGADSDPNIRLQLQKDHDAMQ